MFDPVLKFEFLPRGRGEMTQGPLSGGGLPARMGRPGQGWGEDDGNFRLCLNGRGCEGLARQSPLGKKR